MGSKISKMIDYADWLSEAKEEIKQLNTGQQFILSDLFQRYRWKQLSRADWSFMGNLFLVFKNTINWIVTKTSRSTSMKRLS